jgi:Spy/CpxP family protein refolding chaperone
MKKRSLILAAAAALVVLTIVPFSYAQHMRRGGGPGHGPDGGLGAIMMLGHLEHAKEVLGLSDQQVSDIKAIFGDLRTQNATLHEQLRGSVKAVAEKLIANPNDIAGAQAEMAKQEAAEHTLKVNTLNAASKALNVLTAEQRAKIAEHGAKRMGRLGRR